MVRTKIKDLDLKKMKMAKEVLSFLEILGITEEHLDVLVTLEKDKKVLEDRIFELEKEVKSLKEFRDKTIKIQNAEASGGISKAHKPIVQEFNLNGKR